MYCVFTFTLKYIDDKVIKLICTETMYLAENCLLFLKGTKYKYVRLCKYSIKLHKTYVSSSGTLYF